MLELKKITKIYKTDSFTQSALNKVSISFRENEFVSILGPSGSGKTTLLNIIGGLDDYTSGDLIINGVSTKKFKDRDWDTYRNHKVGFVFQSYNLIPHQTILSNVELALTLSGVSKQERRKRAKEALKKVGLGSHIDKKPNQLSGGQMQRVAIARALVNNPDILLADEPTGALDSKTSTQIMDLLKEVAKDRLVIMVTHNADLAEEYSTRIIELKDGDILGDSNIYDGGNEEKNHSQDKKTNMSFKTALQLSFKNLLTKKGRTILTAFAGSIGIIGIALILSLSNGVQEYIDGVQKETLTSYPITIDRTSIDMTSMMTNAMKKREESSKNEKDKIYANNTIADTLSMMSSSIQSNNLEAFKEYIESGNTDIDEYTTSIIYGYNLAIQLFNPNYENEIVQVNPDTVLDTLGMSNMTGNMSIISSNVWLELFENDELNDRLYQVVSGRMPEKYNEIVILVDENNEITDYVLYALGLKSQKELKELYTKVLNGEQVEEKDREEFDFDDFIGMKFKMLLNTDYYKKSNGIWTYKKDDEKYLKAKLDTAEEIEVVGIIKPNENALVSSTTMGGVLYTKDLEKYVIEKINETEIVKDQKKNKDVNVLTGLKFSTEEFDMKNLSPAQQKYLASLSAEELAAAINRYKEEANATYDTTLEKLGAIDLDKPSQISIFAKDFESKDSVKEIINDYNKKEEEAGREENVLNYSDLVGMLMNSVTSIIDMISYVLIGFVSISLIVSSIMIGIITYISVLERTKEIGILRAIGASKKDVSRVFNAETLIIGLFSGLLGIGLTILLNIPINLIVADLSGVKNVSVLPVVGGIALVLISVILTVIAGLIPSRMASKKDPVEALRSE
ncbi:MAG: ABC transporter ATP-binding protein/permease [Bacilli bacterium]|nr:ABC transporter ATP-binding protein/permease [Bacilli bacterium]